MQNDVIEKMLRLFIGVVLISMLMLAMWSCRRQNGGLSFAVTADEILREYRDDITRAELRYLDKTGKIAGLVGRVQPRERGRVIMQITGKDYVEGAISCMFAGDEAVSGLRGLRAGQEVTVIGKVLGHDPVYGIRIADCTLDLEITGKLTPEPAPEPEPEPEPEPKPEYVPEAVALPAPKPDIRSMPDNAQTTIDDQTWEDISSVVDEWTTAHNDKDFYLFRTLYSDVVNFYNKVYSNEGAVAVKQSLLTGKYADFYQETYDLELRRHQDDKIRADFLKVVYSSGSSNTYQAYLILEKQYGSWQIVKESDLTTDRHLE